MATPPDDRIIVSFRLSRAGLIAIKQLAKKRKQTRTDVIRGALRYAMAHTEEWT